MKKLLVIDNYDSFTYNLVQMFMAFPLDIQVFRSDHISVGQAKKIAPDYVLISPGPKGPKDAGASIDIIKHFFKTIPVLGVCLGMQCINELFDGETVCAPTPVHGKTSIIRHDKKGIFKDIPTRFKAARYHSLMVDLKTKALQITAMSEDDVIMGLSHPRYPLHGVQFHPESFLTQHGQTLIKNFIDLNVLGRN